MDLYRLWITADEYNKYEIPQMITKIFSGWTSPLGLVYVCVISRVDHSLLPAVTAFMFYSNISYIAWDYYRKHNVSRSSFALVLLFFLSRGVYGEVVSGIRSMLAFSFVARCIYDEVYNNKSIIWNIPLYIIMALFHSTSMVAVGIWFVLKVIFEQKGYRRLMYLAVLIAAVSVFYSRWGNIALRNLDVGLRRLSQGDSYSYVWEFAFNSIYMIISLVLIWKTTQGSQLSEDGTKLRIITTAIYGIAMLCITSYSIYHRFISFVTMLSIPVMIESINICDVQGRIVPKRNLFILSVLMMGMSCIKGNLNGIKFFII